MAGPWEQYQSEDKSAAPAEGGGPWTQYQESAPAKEPSGKGGLGIMSLPSDVAEYGARGINAAVQGIGSLTGLDVGKPREPQQTYLEGRGNAANEQYSGLLPAIKESVKTAQLPGDVYAGRVDPLSEEGIAGATKLAATFGLLSPSAATGTTKGIAAVTEPGPGLLGRIAGVTPETMVAKDLARAIARDQSTPEEMMSALAQARMERPEATLADIGGENVRGLVERIAQTPGEGRQAISTSLMTRQQGQMGRLAQDLTGLTGNAKTAVQAVEETMAARKQAAAPLYQKAYAEGDREIWSPELERLTASPTVRGAMQGATKIWRDNAIADGYGALNPGAISERGGLLKFTGDSVPVFPNVQFWDYTKRILDDEIGAAIRAGQNQKVRTLSTLATKLRSELDRQVPAFQAARQAWSGPSQYMAAIEEGRSILGSKMSAEELRARLSGMSDAEREGYRIGAVSAIRGKMGNNPAKMADMTKYLRSSEMREKIAALMPTPQAAASWMQRLNYEVGTSELAGRALGNSATARRIAERQDAENLVGDLVLGAFAHGSVTSSILHRALRAIPNRIRGRLRAKSDPILARTLTDPAGGMTALQRLRGQQQGGRVTSEGYDIDSPEFKEEVRLALARNPDSPAHAQAQRNRRGYLPNSPESINIEDRRGLRGSYSQRAHADYQRGGAVKISSRTGTHTIPVEVASTPAQQAKGLSGRRTLGKGRGMLFDLSSVRPTSFWMNNTYIPLDMIFIRADGRIAKIAENRKPLSRERVLSGGPVAKVLEVAAGTARRLRLMPGDRVL